MPRNYQYRKTYPKLSEEATTRKRESSKIRLAEWRKNNPDAYQAQRKKWYEKNKKRLLEYCKKHRKENPEMYAAWSKKTQLKNIYGITVEQYEEIKTRQNNCCAICKEDLVDSKLTHLDHCHSTNKVRGFLCQRCNHGLGHFRDNVEFLQSAVSYIKEYQ